MTEREITAKIAETVCAFQNLTTGHMPKAVTAVLSEDTLVVTLHEALTPAEIALAQNAEGATQVQEFHRHLFATSCESLRQQIQRITGRAVRDAVAEVGPAPAAIVQTFATGIVVLVFLLVPPTDERLLVAERTVV